MLNILVCKMSMSKNYFSGIIFTPFLGRKSNFFKKYKFKKKSINIDEAEKKLLI